MARISSKTKPKTIKHPKITQERPVSIAQPVLPGYTHVPKGDVYITRHCRTRTLATNQCLYIVHAVGQPNKTVGLRVPSSIAKAVFADAAATKKSRSLARGVKDLRDVKAAKSMLLKLYPKLPAQLTQVILSHGFAKYSGRVGRASGLDLDQRVHFAVQAHARHKHTRYEVLLKTVDRESARKAVKKEVDAIIQGWSGIRKVERTKIARPRPRADHPPKKRNVLQSSFSKPEILTNHGAMNRSRYRLQSRRAARVARKLIPNGLRGSQL